VQSQGHCIRQRRQLFCDRWQQAREVLVLDSVDFGKQLVFAELFCFLSHTIEKISLPDGNGAIEGTCGYP
jgi:hypothetical protein